MESGEESDFSLDDLFDLQMLGVKRSLAHSAYACLPDVAQLRVEVTRSSFVLRPILDDKAVAGATTHEHRFRFDHILAEKRHSFSYYPMYLRVFGRPTDASGRAYESYNHINLAVLSELTVRKIPCVSVEDYFKGRLRDGRMTMAMPHTAEGRESLLTRLQQLALVLGVPRDTILRTRRATKEGLRALQHSISEHIQEHPLNFSLVEDVVEFLKIANEVVDWLGSEPKKIAKCLQYIHHLRVQSTQDGLVHDMKTCDEVLRERSASDTAEDN
jgi:hypothetical protein